MKKYFTKNKYNRGFTIVETLVAVSIFSMSILALLVVLTQGVSNTNYAKAKITASYLAQEGIEYMRNIRDTFVLYDSTDTQTGWNAFYATLIDASACQSANGCYFDDNGLDYSSNSQPMTTISLTACGANCPTLQYDSGSVKYGYHGGVDSGFIRKIRISQISANEIKIFSTVFWTQGSGSYNITLTESLFNWAE